MLKIYKLHTGELAKLFLLVVVVFLMSPGISLAAAPTTSTLSPIDGEDDAEQDTNLVITFSESVTATTTISSFVTIKKSDDDSTIEAIDVSGSQVTGSGSVTITVNPTSDLSAGTSYYVQIDSNAFFNGTDEYYAGISDTTTWNFQVSGGGGSGTLTTPPAPNVSVRLDGSVATVSGSYGGDVIADEVGFTYENSGSEKSVSFSGRPSGFSYIVRNLECGTHYTFIGYAKNSVATSYSDGVKISTGACSVAEEVTAPESPEDAGTAAIAELLAQIAQLQTQLLALQGGGVNTGATCEFTRDLTLDSSGADITCLQNYLISTGHFTFSGGATGYFGPITQSAVAVWQAANGVSPAAGYFGTISQEKYTEVNVVQR